MRVLVTGGAGFIGSHLVKKLVGGGHSVAVIDNLRRGTPDNLASVSNNVDFHQADIRDSFQLSTTMKECAVVFHLAAISSVVEANEDIAETSAANVEGTARVLQAAARAGVRRVVFTSSREVYGDASSTP